MGAYHPAIQSKLVLRWTKIKGSSLMRKNARLLLLLLGAAGAASAQSPLPADVRLFVNNAELCEHMAGEWDSDLAQKRKKEIEGAIKRYCGMAQRQHKLLGKKYQTDAGMQKILAAHANDSVTSYSP